VASDIESILAAMTAGGSVHFNDLFKVCKHYFGKPRNSGSSHYIFKTPWPGDPRINIQNDKGKAYPIRQVLAAIAKLAGIEAAKKAASHKPETTADRKPPKKK
jgi:hypothetical protein